jgi:prolyl-tRNA synthetase
MEKQAVFMGRRDLTPKQKEAMSVDDFCARVPEILQSIQDAIYERAKDFLKSHMRRIDTLDELRSFFTPTKADDDKEIFGGWALVHWNEAAIGHSVFKELKITPRCIPLPNQELGIGIKESGNCVFTGQPSTMRIIVARSY